MRRTLLGALATFATIAACGACGSNSGHKPANQAPPADEVRSYRATIRWTGHGVPHIEAADLESLTFGQGYAFASQHVCVLADQIVKVRSERSRYFGPGDGGANLDSDFGYLALDVRGRAEQMAQAASEESRQVIRGFAAGYNKYLADTGVDALPPDCRGAAWVKPVSDIDIATYGVSISMIGSSGYFVETIGAAQPAQPATGDGKGARLVAPVHESPASNGWGIGGEMSANGRGLLVANPHFPWEGALRFYETHLTIPGDFDVYGATLLGLPLVSIGFSENVAWTHTFSSSTRFVLYRLTLADGNPTSYSYGTETRALTATEHTIGVLQDDGTVADVKRTLYHSHYGPMLGGGQTPWTASTAFAIRDVTGAPGSVDQYLAMFRAKGLADFQKAFETYQATPFVNTIYADREGNAWYVDGSAVPDMSFAAIKAWQFGMKSMPALKAAWDTGVVALDGSMPLFELQADDGAAMPGAIPFARAPRLARRDYVLNANDPYWLTNPDALVTGKSPLYGEAERAPSARTRMNHALLRGAKQLTRDELESRILTNRAMTAELLRDAVVERCERAGKKLAKACEVLAAWDTRYNADSVGAVLWREWLAAIGDDSMWDEPFDPKRPLETPRGLAAAPAKGPDPVVTALETAVATLDRAKVDWETARLAHVQFTMKGSERIGVPGADWRAGSTNPAFYSGSNSTLLPAMDAGTLVNSTTGLTDKGYPVNYGTSFLMVVGFEDDGPQADAIMTYSASSDPASPWFADQTRMYARGQWRPVLFRPEAIQRDPALKVVELAGP
jgi:acyl-homoserine-lactone acylase